jgi:hypothetical protein
MSKILVFDIETSPITAYTWGLWDVNIGLNQIKKDWSIIAWAAKWYGEPASKVMYMDNRQAKDLLNDRNMVVRLGELINQSDGVITQNGKSFDVKKLNARAAIHRLPPIAPVNNTDLLRESRKVFKFTSHKLEYMSDVLNTKYKKLKHDDYPGFDLWKAIMDGDKKAWAAMKTYCIHDVLSTEEAIQKIQGWIKTQNVQAFTNGQPGKCTCGSRKLESRGFYYTSVGQYRRYRCMACGKWTRGATNLLTVEQRRGIIRETK